MKVLADRPGEDDEDVRLLAAHLGLDQADQVLAVAERTYGDRLDPARGSSSKSSLRAGAEPDPCSGNTSLGVRG